MGRIDEVQASAFQASAVRADAAQASEVRTVLRLNAGVTAACGAVMLVAGAPLAAAMEVDRLVVTAVAAFFLVLGVDVWLLAGRSAGVAIGTARLLAVADAGWTAATVAVVAAGLVPFPGALLPLAVAAVTAGFTVAEHRAAGTARAAAPILA